MKNYSKLLSMALVSTFVLGVGIPTGSVLANAEEETHTSDSILQKPSELIDKSQAEKYNDNKVNEIKESTKEQRFGLVGDEQDKTRQQTPDRIFSKSFQPNGYLGLFNASRGTGSTSVSSDSVVYSGIRLYKAPLGELKDPSKDVVLDGNMQGKNSSKLMEVKGVNKIGEEVAIKNSADVVLKDEVMNTKNSKDPSKWEVNIPLKSHNVIVVDTRNQEQGQGWVVNQDVKVKAVGKDFERELENYELIEGRSVFNYGGTVTSPVNLVTSNNPYEVVYTEPVQFEDNAFSKSVEEALTEKLYESPVDRDKVQPKDYAEISKMRQIGNALYDQYGADLSNYPEYMKFSNTRTENGVQKMASVDHVGNSTVAEVDKAGQNYKNGKGVTFLSYGQLPDYQRKIILPYAVLDNMSVKSVNGNKSSLEIDTTYTVSAIPNK